MDKRIQREDATRDNETRPSMVWQPPALLPDPKPQDGYGFRWIRVSMLNQSDDRNASVRFREGWELCKAEDHPEMSGALEAKPRFQGSIEIGGLVLCKAPIELLRSRAQYHAKMNKSQMDAVDNQFMKEQDSRMPLFNQKHSRVEFGKGSPVAKK